MTERESKFNPECDRLSLNMAVPLVHNVSLRVVYYTDSRRFSLKYKMDVNTQVVAKVGGERGHNPKSGPVSGFIRSIKAAVPTRAAGEKRAGRVCIYI